MSYAFRVQPSGNLALVVFEGAISMDEERRALSEFTSLPDVRPDMDILVDRSGATSALGPKEVGPMLDMAKEAFPREGPRPRMAIVAPSDLDFGMARMLELTGGERTPHQIQVVRTLEEACAWLGVEVDDLVWPEADES